MAHSVAKKTRNGMFGNDTTKETWGGDNDNNAGVCVRNNDNNARGGGVSNNI